MSAAKYVGSPLARITAVLVVAERGRAEPQRAALLVDVPASRSRSTARSTQPSSWRRGLARPDVEVDAEVLQAGLDPGTTLVAAQRPTIPALSAPSAVAAAQTSAGSSRARSST